MEFSSTHSQEEIEDIVSEKALQLRNAIRWLAEAQRFKGAYSGHEWRGGIEGELAEVSDKVFTEAMKSVVYARRELEKAREQYNG